MLTMKRKNKHKKYFHYGKLALTMDSMYMEYLESNNATSQLETKGRCQSKVPPPLPSPPTCPAHCPERPAVLSSSTQLSRSTPSSLDFIFLLGD